MELDLALIAGLAPRRAGPQLAGSRARDRRALVPPARPRSAGALAPQPSFVRPSRTGRRTAPGSVSSGVSTRPGAGPRELRRRAPRRRARRRVHRGRTARRAPRTRDRERPERPDRARPPAGRASAAGDRRQDLDLVAVGHRRLEAVAEADVLAVHVDVDEPAQGAVAVGQPVAQLAVALEQRVEHLADRPALELELTLAAGRRPQLRGDLDLDRHHARAPAPSTFAVNSSNDGAISWTSNVPRTASSVLSPSPVMTSTTRSPGSMSPRAASLARTAVVVPPAVSVKMPVVSASRRMPARISSSETASIEPPVRRARSSAYGPSAGLPIASDLAIVLGRTGVQKSCPAANAPATGEQPSACAPFIVGTAPSMSPSSSHSAKPLAIFVYSEPEAIGATSRSGVTQPSCSAISYASVLEPSE